MGKAQRILAGLDPEMGPIFAHEVVSEYSAIYEGAGIDLPATLHPAPDAVRQARGRGLIIAPLSAVNSAWLASLGPVTTALAAGWLQVRGALNRYPIDLGLVFSDHADWSALTATIRATGAEEVYVTHGKADVLVRWLRQHGLNANPLETPFEGEAQSEPAELREAVGADDVQPPV